MRKIKLISAFMCLVALSALMTPSVALATNAPMITIFVALIAIGLILPAAPIGSIAMAVVQNPLIGRSRNKLGGTVFSTWKGKNILKGKPLTVANPKTDGQLAQRSAMRQIVALGRKLLNTTRLSFIEAAIGSTEWASFIKYNLDEAFTISPPNATFNNKLMNVARGTLVGVANGAVTAGGVFSWDDNTGSSGAEASDLFGYAVIGSAGEDRGHAIINRTRADGSFSSGITVVSGDGVYVWFVSAVKGKASDSDQIN